MDFRSYDVAVVGGGPAGMMAAISAAEWGAGVVLLEKNSFTGKKLRITGKGRCNLTNNCTPAEALAAVCSNPKFLYGVINRFTPADTMSFFEDCGVPLKTERGRRVFPVSDNATDIRDALLGRMKSLGVTVICGADVHGVAETEEGFAVCYGGRRSLAKTVIFATGGVSYPGTGSTGDGHRILEEMGAEVTPLRPSLVPIVTEDDFYDLSGLTLKNVRLTVKHNGKTVFSEMGEMLFTHFGVSGPLVLSASANMQDAPLFEYAVEIDLKPALSAEELDRRLISDLAKYAARDFVNSLGDLLPIKLIPYVVERSGIPERKKTGSISREERLALGRVLKGFEITPSDFRPIDEAIITRGGIDVRQVSPKTMELKEHPGIFACGELLDVDAYTGGYNLQIAFSTGRAAGIGAAEKALY